MAVIKKEKGRSVTLDVDQETKWDAEGLVKLAAALRGVADTLRA